MSVGWRKVTSPDEMVRLSGWVREQNSGGASTRPNNPGDVEAGCAKAGAAIARASKSCVEGDCKKYSDLVNPTEFVKITRDLDYKE